MDGWNVLLITHAFCAAVALLLGGLQLWVLPTGDRRHRLIGRAWVALMLYVAISSFWITGLNGDSWSFLHVLSLVTIVSVVMGVVAVRRGNLLTHQSSMRGAWFGLSGAFVFAVAVPSRHIPQLVLNRPLAFLAALALVVVTTAVVVAVGFVTIRPTRSPT